MPGKRRNNKRKQKPVHEKDNSSVSSNSAGEEEAFYEPPPTPETPRTPHNPRTTGEIHQSLKRKTPSSSMPSAKRRTPETDSSDLPLPPDISTSNNTSSAPSVSFASSSGTSNTADNSLNVVISTQLNEIMKAVNGLTAQVGKLDGRVNSIEQKSASRDDDDDVDDDDDSNEVEETRFYNPEIIEPEMWLRESLHKLRVAYKIPFSIKDNQLLSAVSDEALKDQTPNDVRKRIQYLLLKYRDILCKLDSNLKFADITSKGYAKLAELVHIKTELLEFSLNSPVDLTTLFEVTELCYMIGVVEKTFLHEGLHRSNFDVANDFIDQYITTARFDTSTEKERQKLRDNHLVKKVTLSSVASNKTTKPFKKKWKPGKKSFGPEYKGTKPFGKDKDK